MTSNYAARAFGVRKLMGLEDACKLCPGLIVADGEDLKPFRECSFQIRQCLDQGMREIVQELGGGLSYGFEKCGLDGESGLECAVCMVD